MREPELKTQSLEALHTHTHTHTHTSNFIEIGNEYINMKKDRLCAKVKKERLQNSLSFLCAFKSVNAKDKYF